MLKMSKFKALKQYHYCHKEIDWVLAIHTVELPLLKEVRRFSQGLLLSWRSDIVHLNCSTIITVTGFSHNELWSQRLTSLSSLNSSFQLVFFNRQFRCSKTWPTKNYSFRLHLRLTVAIGFVYTITTEHITECRCQQGARKNFQLKFSASLKIVSF